MSTDVASILTKDTGFINHVSSNFGDVLKTYQHQPLQFNSCPILVRPVLPKGKAVAKPKPQRVSARGAAAKAKAKADAKSKAKAKAVPKSNA